VAFKAEEGLEVPSDSSRRSHLSKNGARDRARKKREAALVTVAENRGAMVATTLTDEEEADSWRRSGE
jgi:hypothetical protein